LSNVGEQSYPLGFPDVSAHLAFDGRVDRPPMDDDLDIRFVGERHADAYADTLAPLAVGQANGEHVDNELLVGMV
jgi:hypothetical protein